MDRVSSKNRWVEDESGHAGGKNHDKKRTSRFVEKPLGKLRNQQKQRTEQSATHFVDNRSEIDEFVQNRRRLAKSRFVKKPMEIDEITWSRDFWAVYHFIEIHWKNQRNGGGTLCSDADTISSGNRYLEDEMVESGESGCLDRISSPTHWERVTSLDGDTQSAYNQ